MATHRTVRRFLQIFYRDGDNVPSSPSCMPESIIGSGPVIFLSMDIGGLTWKLMTKAVQEAGVTEIDETCTHLFLSHGDVKLERIKLEEVMEYDGAVDTYLQEKYQFISRGLITVGLSILVEEATAIVHQSPADELPFRDVLRKGTGGQVEVHLLGESGYPHELSFLHEFGGVQWPPAMKERASRLMSRLRTGELSLNLGRGKARFIAILPSQYQAEFLNGEADRWGCRWKSKGKNRNSQCGLHNNFPSCPFSVRLDNDTGSGLTMITYLAFHDHSQ